MTPRNLEYHLFGRTIAYKWVVLSVTTIGAVRLLGQRDQPDPVPRSCHRTTR